jgi:hypothetical protein
MNTTNDDELYKRVEHERKLIAKHQAVLNELTRQCTHARTTPKSEYVSGDYYNTSYTEHWNECRICGEKLNRKTVRHGNHG